jgi:bifunctional DNase/RNase
VDTLRCESQTCDEPAAGHFLQVVNGQLEERHLCVVHGLEHVARHKKKFGDPMGGGSSALGLAAPVECAIHLLFSYPTHNPPYGYVELREKNGNRVFGFIVDLFACAELDRALHATPTPRPLIHRAILDLVSMFGGHVQRIEVKVIPSDSRVYGGSLIVEQSRKEIVLDMRASDALVLAVLDQAPIFLPQDLLVTATVID